MVTLAVCRIPMDFMDLWIPMNPHGFPWIAMDLWISIDFYGSHGLLLIPMDPYGFPWIPVDSH